ncbi:hypothetical protein PRZ48_004611 [Zasmidium cellare]|uniref:Xylanolytic transcriptional activator regulatory domain-containing protein n=1 Tax=Zasmidium cellare TaxID=395010 RepID=A0ABR0ER20_ZASCE|nr:hypothetical protein PRZ48_004611 [Zasmidium cellare]
MSTGSDISLDYPEMSGLNLPPTDVALKLLNLAKTTKQNFFSRHQIIDETEFTQICTKIYFPTSPYDISSWIMLNIGLHGLLLGCKKSDSGSTGIFESEANSYIKLCTRNIDAATSTARMSLDLGLHRVPLGSRSEEFTKKRLIFYYIYLLDISFAFSIGMTPNIHDYDVTTERPVFPDDLSGFRGRSVNILIRTMLNAP